MCPNLTQAEVFAFGVGAKISTRGIWADFLGYLSIIKIAPNGKFPLGAIFYISLIKMQV